MTLYDIERKIQFCEITYAHAFFVIKAENKCFNGYIGLGLTLVCPSVSVLISRKHIS